MEKSKVLFLVSFFIIQSSFIISQDALKQGVYSLSGSISYSNSSNTVDEWDNQTTKTINIFIEPSLNYFIIDNLSIGGSFLYYYSETDISNMASHNFNFINKTIGIGPDIRYYFSNNIFIPFIGIADFYSKDIGSSPEGNIFTAIAGINYFFSNSVALEPFLSYSISSMNNPKQTTNTFSVGFRINYFIIN